MALDACGTLGAWLERPGLVRAYFEPRPERELRRGFRDAWLAAAGGAPPPSVELRTIPASDWLASFRAAARPVPAGARLWIAPPDAAPPPGGYPPDAIVVAIRPGQGFGTGTHPTTRSLLRWLEDEPGFETVLDVGTGSGVLALAAVALGARSAVGLEIDEAALENALENRALNGARSLALVRGSIGAVAAAARFDRVLANLDRPTLGNLLRDVAQHVAPGGRLGIAGLLLGEEEETLEVAVGHRLTLADHHVGDDPATGDRWWSGWFRGPA